MQLKKHKTNFSVIDLCKKEPKVEGALGPFLHELKKNTQFLMLKPYTFVKILITTLVKISYKCQIHNNVT